MGVWCRYLHRSRYENNDEFRKKQAQALQHREIYEQIYLNEYCRTNTGCFGICDRRIAVDCSHQRINGTRLQKLLH